MADAKKMPVLLPSGKDRDSLGYANRRTRKGGNPDRHEPSTGTSTCGAVIPWRRGSSAYEAPRTLHCRAKLDVLGVRPCSGRWTPTRCDNFT